MRSWSLTRVIMGEMPSMEKENGGIRSNLRVLIMEFGFSGQGEACQPGYVRQGSWVFEIPCQRHPMIHPIQATYDKMLKEIPKELSVPTNPHEFPNVLWTVLSCHVCAGEADHPLCGQRASQSERLRGTTGYPSLGGRLCCHVKQGSCA